MKKIAAVVLAALVVFAINALSWVVLPFHYQTTHKFTDEDAVAGVLKANAPISRSVSLSIRRYA